MARIPQPKIDEILSATNIASYIARYVSLKQTGKNFKGLCPFHKEKTPSFIVSPEKQIFHCFGCGKGGNVFSFLMGIENISYFEAIRKVAFDLGIKLPEYTDDKYESGESEYDKLYNANESARDFFVSELSKKGMSPARDYLKNRKLKLKTIKKFEIGFAPNKWDALINSNLIKGFIKLSHLNSLRLSKYFFSMLPIFLSILFFSFSLSSLFNLPILFITYFGRPLKIFSICFESIMS